MTLSLSVFTGTNAATEATGQTAVTLLSADSASTNPATAEVAPGTNSYERWLAVRIDDAAGTTYSNFWVECSVDPPTGVTIKLGAADAGATPTSATSAVATTTLSAGRRYTWDTGTYDTAGQKTRFLVLQEQTTASAASGAIPTESITIGWQAG